MFATLCRSCLAVTRSSMRVAVVQFAPKIGQVQENVQTARRLCEQLRPNSVDLVCLPEMIFTGYVFPNAAAIAPHLEHPRTGPTSRFCAELSARLHCYVVAGYPERLEPHEQEEALDEHDITKVGANSAVLYGPDGECIGDYRKTNLYETDMTWAKAGNGFMTFNLPPPLGTVTLGICMDLNPQPPAEWTLEDGPYEIADHVVTHNSNLLVLLNAWLDSGWDETADKDEGTIRYWAARLRPLWAVAPNGIRRGKGAIGFDAHDTKGETYVVVCNRCGQENGKTFAGTSSLYQMRRASGKPRLKGSMKRHEEGVAIWTIP